MAKHTPEAWLNAQPALAVSISTLRNLWLVKYGNGWTTLSDASDDAGHTYEAFEIDNETTNAPLTTEMDWWLAAMRLNKYGLMESTEGYGNIKVMAFRLIDDDAPRPTENLDTSDD